MTVLELAERLRPGSALAPRSAVQRSFAFAEEPDLARLAAAARALAGRHPSLRAADVVALDVHAGEPGEELRHAIGAVAYAPFDVDRGPLLRVAWLRRGRGGVLVLALHHSAGDAGALDVVQEELAALHEGRPLPPAPAHARLPAPPHPDAVAWWRGALAGARRGALPSAGEPLGETVLVSRRFGPEADAALDRLAGRHAASPFMVLLAALVRLLDDGRDGEERDLTVFTLDPARSTGSRGVVAFLAEPLPVRIRLPRDASLADAVAASRAAVLDAFEHRLPLLGLLGAAPRLAVPLLRGRRPATLVQYLALRPLVLGGVRGDPLPTFEAGRPGAASPTPVPIDLDVVFERLPGGHAASALYDPGRWDARDVAAALAGVEAAVVREGA